MLLNIQLLTFLNKNFRLDCKKFNCNIRTIYQGKNFDPNFHKNKVNSNNPNSNYKGKNFDPNFNKTQLNSNYKGKNFDPNYNINKLNIYSNYKYKFNYNNDKFYSNDFSIKKNSLIYMNYDLIYKKNIFFNFFNDNLNNIDKFNLFFNKIITFKNKNNYFYDKNNYNIKYLNVLNLIKTKNNLYFNIKKNYKGLNYKSEILKAIVLINSINISIKKKLIKNYKIKFYNYKSKKKEYVYNKFINIDFFNSYLNNNFKKIKKINIYINN